MRSKTDILNIQFLCLWIQFPVIFDWIITVAGLAYSRKFPQINAGFPWIENMYTHITENQMQWAIKFPPLLPKHCQLPALSQDVGLDTPVSLSSRLNGLYYRKNMMYCCKK